MVDVASLQLKIDSTDAKKAVDDLNMLGKASATAEGQTNSLGKSWVKASSDAGKLRMAQLQAGEAAEEMGRDMKGAGVAASQMAKDAQQAAAGMGRINQASGSTRAGMQQLSYQIGDVATMFSLGARPMQIFASQSGQVVQALQLMSHGAKGFIGFLAGPWGIALTAAATVTGALVAKLWESKDALEGSTLASNGLSDAQSVLGGMFDLTTGKIKNQNEMLRLNAQLMAMNLRNEALAARTDAQGIASESNQLSWSGLFSQRGGGFRDTQRRSRNTAASQLLRDVIAGRVDAGEAQARASRWDFSGIDVNKMEYMEALSQALTARLKEQTAAEIEASLKAGELSESLRKAGKETKAKADKLTDAEKAYKKSIADSTRYAESLEQEAAKIGKTALEIHRMEVAAGAAAAPTRELALRIKEAGAAIGDDMIAQAVKKHDELIKRYEQENELLGLLGPAREEAALRLEEEAFKADLAAKGVENVEEKWQEYLAVRLEGINRRTALDADLEAARMLEDQIYSVIGALRGMGGIGGSLGGLVGALASGNPIAGLAGLGGIGTLGAMALQPSLFGGVGDALTTGFSKLGVYGNLGAGLGYGLAGAGIGSSLGGLVGSGTGGAIGGGLGGLAVGLGAISGPLAPLVAPLAGILGGLVGNLFGSTSRGGAIFNGADVTGFYGNSSGRKDASAGFAGSAIDALNQIAAALGGIVDPTSGKVSITVREDQIYVDPQGRGYSKQSKFPDIMGFGQDSEAAIAAAVKNLIEDGVLKGISDSAMRLLQAGGDFQAQLQKALTFQGVLDYVEQQTDPLGYAMAQLGAEMQGLTAIFNEAGATSAELAALAQYQKLKEQEIQQQLGNTAQRDAAAQRAAANARAERDERLSLEVRLLEAQGNAVAALAKARELELDQIDKANRTLLSQIHATEDLANAYARQTGELKNTAEEMKQLGETLRSFRDSLFGTGNSSLSYETALMRLVKTGGLAGTGDSDAIGKLPGVGTDFLAVARSRAGSLADEQRAIALVANYVDQAIAATDGAISTADKQLAELEKQVSGLLDINESVISVEEAIKRLTEVMGGEGSDDHSNGRKRKTKADRENEQRMERLERQQAETQATMAAVADNTDRMARKFDLWDENGALAIATRTGDTVTTA